MNLISGWFHSIRLPDPAPRNVTTELIALYNGAVENGLLNDLPQWGMSFRVYSGLRVHTGLLQEAVGGTLLFNLPIRIDDTLGDCVTLRGDHIEASVNLSGLPYTEKGSPR